MEDVKIEKVSWTENVAERIALWAAKDQQIDRIQYLKLKLGLETFIVNISKMIVVYTAAFLFSILIETVIFHISYYFIRRTAYGIHATTNFLCSLISVITFVGIPYVAVMVPITNYIVLGVFVINGIILYQFAPRFTKKNPNLQQNNRHQLRNKSIAMCFILMFVTLLVPSEIMKTLITSGVSLASVLTISFSNSNKKGGRKSLD